MEFQEWPPEEGIIEGNKLNISGLPELDEIIAQYFNEYELKGSFITSEGWEASGSYDGYSGGGGGSIFKGNFEGHVRLDFQWLLHRITVLLIGLHKRLNRLENYNNPTGQFQVFTRPIDPHKTGRDTHEQFTLGYGFKAILDKLEFIENRIKDAHLDQIEIQQSSAIIEHWQIPLEAQKEQIVLLFGEWNEGKKRIGSAKYQMTLPKLGREFLQKNLDNTFHIRKGNHQLLCTRADNSKIHIYGEDSDECWRVWGEIEALTTYDWTMGITYKETEWVGLNFEQKLVYLRRINYYAEGSNRSYPDLWKHFSNRLGEGIISQKLI